MKFWKGNRYFLKIGRRNFDLYSIMKMDSGKFMIYFTIGKKKTYYQLLDSREKAKLYIEKLHSECGPAPKWTDRTPDYARYMSGDCLLAVVYKYRDTFYSHLYCRNAMMENPKTRKFKTIEESIEFVEKYIGCTEEK